MSFSLDILKRKSDGKILFDLVNDACDVHNIFDGDTFVESTESWNIEIRNTENNNNPEYVFVEPDSPEAPKFTFDEWDELGKHYRKLL